ncbi:hypothetical protein BpHYR1_036430 [Brachionus plicatilis]|uniref:Uncharacterized protein n=1 Tax=Brachionus plicatilis TaxID=10195 RepID=A0A3M7QDQ8_BRAPC|nr:hypothetical protein BpHYR1_036430 [Brachionus plicatilis]
MRKVAFKIIELQLVKNFDQRHNFLQSEYPELFLKSCVEFFFHSLNSKMKNSALRNNSGPIK